MLLAVTICHAKYMRRATTKFLRVFSSCNVESQYYLKWQTSIWFCIDLSPGVCCPPLLCQVWRDEEGSVRSKTGSRRLEGKEKLELKINSASDWTKKEFQLKMLKRFNSQSQNYKRYITDSAKNWSFDLGSKRILHIYLYILLCKCIC